MEEKFDPRGEEKEEEEERELELVLFQVNECYVYLIPPRKSTSSYRADEWNVNKWTWEGALKVVSKGEECIIKLEDHSTGGLYARAFLRKGEPHPVEAVIDSSRYFVLRIEENFGGRIRHAFIGIGFRERTQAYDFQAALHDHMKYLNKKQAAEEMEQTYTTKASVDYSLKEGEKLILQLNNKGTHSIRPLEETRNSLSPDNDVSLKDTVCSLKPPPPPPQTKVQALSTRDVQVVGKDQSNAGTMNKLNGSLREDGNQVEESREQSGVRIENDLCEVDDDFGDFQTA